MEDEYDDIELDAFDLAEISEIERRSTDRTPSRLQGSGSGAIGAFSQKGVRHHETETRFDSSLCIDRAAFDSRGQAFKHAHQAPSINGIRLIPTSTFRMNIIFPVRTDAVEAKLTVCIFSSADRYRDLFSFPTFNSMQTACFDVVSLYRLLRV
jgi:hypothetical protein